MLRRLCTLLLMLACALAPVLPAQAAKATKADCCCGAACACDTSKPCVPPPAAPVRAPEAVTTAVEQRVTAAKPVTRVAFAAFARLLVNFELGSTLSVRPESANRIAPAAGVALFEAHCSRLI
jgi:hypothetical protein